MVLARGGTLAWPPDRDRAALEADPQHRGELRLGARVRLQRRFWPTRSLQSGMPSLALILVLRRLCATWGTNPLFLQEREALDHQVSREIASLRSRQDALQTGLQGLREDLQAVDQQLQATIEVCLGVVAGLEAVTPEDAAGPAS